jgi:8-oxo-dGTP pyrophosphatase MutT (NUDIX family)
VVLHADDGAFALQKRCFSPDIFFRGYWCLFGGLIEGSETPEAAAKRELHEELGIEITLLDPLLDLKWGPESMPDNRPRHRYYFASKLAHQTLPTLTTNEGLGLKVFEPGELPRMDQVVPWDAAAMGLFLAERDPTRRIYPREFDRSD